MGQPFVMLSVTRLLHHLSQVFRENIQPKDAVTVVRHITVSGRSRSTG